MPRGLLGDLGRVEYNGYRFNNTTRTLAVRVRPVFDSAGRTTVYNEWYIQLQTFISSSSTTSPEVKDAVAKLSHRGRRLIFQGRGLGNPDVNTGGMKDVKWGPEPGEIGLHVIGQEKAVRLTWSVTFRLPNCANGRYDFAALEFNYTVEHLVDDAGFVTRTVRGHLVIPLTWNGEARTLTDQADDYRMTITPPLLLRFRRTFGPWVVSEDRTRLDFSIIDTEMPGDVLPPGIVDARASETVSSSQLGLKQYIWTISASYRMRRGLSGLDAARAFFDLVTKRVRMLELNGQQNPFLDSKGRPVPIGRALIPVGFSMTNPDHYGRPAAEFSLSFTFSHQLQTILNLTGLWAKLDDPQNQVPGTQLHTWQGWADSLANSAFHPYGGARLRFTTASDAIDDLCNPEAVLKGSLADVQRLTTTELRGSNTFPPSAIVTEAKIGELMSRAFVPPAPNASWLQYQNELWLDLDNGAVPVRMLPQAVLKAADDVLGAVPDIGGRVLDALAKTPFGAVLGLGLSVTGIPQAPGIPGGRLEAGGGNGSLRRVRADGYVFLRGYAVRAGHPIDPPRLLDVDGVPAVPANRYDRGEGFGKGVRANGNVPLHFCRWNLRYYLSRLTDKPLPTPPNPLQGGA